MKKRILSLILAALVIVGMLPPVLNASAEEVLPEVVLCPDCGQENCPGGHVWCEICQGFDCGLVCGICNTHGCTLSHLWCESCGIFDCGLYCTVCGTHACTTEHIWCDSCLSFDCGVDHSADQPADKGIDLASSECTCGTTTDVHLEGCIYYTEPAPECTCGTTTDVHLEGCIYYTEPAPKCTCGTTTDVHLEGCIYYTGPAPECTCGTTTDVHTEDCPLYSKPAPECSCGTTTDVHTEDCPLYSETGESCEICGQNPCVCYDPSGAIGSYAVLTEGVSFFLVADDPSGEDDFVFDSVDLQAGTVFYISDAYWNPNDFGIYYQVSFYRGGLVGVAADYWPAGSWILQNYSDESWELPTLSPVQPGFCRFCGDEFCSITHFVCKVCGSSDCSQSHVYCYACEKYDCGLSHKYCYICKDYDCGLTHTNPFRPIVAPIFPSAPSVGGGVTINDRYGNIISGAYTMLLGMKDSLAAYSALGGYQWQVCYDTANDLWVNIQGQTGSGIVLSPAMFAGIINHTGEAKLRCAASDGSTSLFSAPITLGFVQPSVDTFRGTVGSLIPTANEDDAVSKKYVVVQYVYANGNIASSNRLYELGVNNGLTDSHSIPVIPGYKAELEYSYDNKVTLADNRLTLNFAAADLTEYETVVTVKYSVDYVDYTVIHHCQNVYDDNYTEIGRETISGVHKTGQVITDVHKSIAGFYNLLYETPAAAADGSTVIEIFYDRYYYLMSFVLGDKAFGTEPVYARYGAPIEVEEPTRPGYTFLGWSLDGTTKVDLPATMPAGNTKYTALWQVDETADVTIVLWDEDPNTGAPEYHHSVVIQARPGDTVTWETLQYKCGLPAHTHSDSCGLSCTMQEHSHSLEGGCYNLNCDETGHSHDNCTLDCKHSHTIDCFTASGGLVKATYQDNTDRLPNNTENGRVYSYTRYGNTYYYLRLNNQWYRSGNGAKNNPITLNCSHTHGDDCYTCGLEEVPHVHTVEGGCYVLSCKIPDHTHVGACYSCGMSEHSHTSVCDLNWDEEMDPDLWIYDRSEEAVVEADGSTKINVYYKRKAFTMTFRYGYNNGSYRSSSSITDKWGADIGQRFIDISALASSNLWSASSDGSSPWTGYLQIMPGNDVTYYCRYTSKKAQTAKYYTETLTPGEYELEYSVTAYYDNNLTISKEDFYEMEGFTYAHGTDGKGNSMSSPGSYSNFGGSAFYYTRNSYKLVFNDGYSNVHSETVKYEASLADYDDFVPVLPSAYEPGSRTFAGWYTNPECTGDQYVLDDKTMPANDIILYAKWELVEHNVNYYLTRDSLDRDETIPEEMSRVVQEGLTGGIISETPTDVYTEVFAEDTVRHGSYIGEVPDPMASEGYQNIHPRSGYDFLGWFYINEQGEEEAFVPESMPVNRDLDLYGKWGADKLCQFNIYYALDADADGVADKDESGNVIYVADPDNGSGIAGHTYTFTAEENLYAAYNTGYFPNVGSHSITIDIKDELGETTNAYTFLYRPIDKVPYTVKYLEKDTRVELADPKTVSDNTKIVVTENFLPINSYMPDAYQKSLVVSADGSNEIIFWYTKDALHAIYVVNHYIETLDADLNHAGWIKYTSFQSTGDIGSDYIGEAIDIKGFALSVDYTDRFNTVQKVNAFTGNRLPTDVSVLYDSNTKIHGTLGENGMELNFYYVRNAYPYEFRYVLKDAGTQLAEPTVGIAPYDTNVTQQAKEIRLDLDNDGIKEEYRLYNPTETTKSIHINTDGDPITPGTVVVAGMATVNIATFEYVRCTEDLTVTKTVIDKSGLSDPDSELEFEFSLKIHALSGYHKNSYATVLSDGSTGTVSPKFTASDIIEFKLKGGQSITILDLPTADYTLTELNVPTGYTAEYSPAVRNSLIEGEPLTLTVTNTYDPAVLSITKDVDMVETGNPAEVTDFEFTVFFPDGAELDDSYVYELIVDGEVTGTLTAAPDFTNRRVVITLADGQTARFLNLPEGAYTVAETDYRAYGYNSYVSLNGGAAAESRSAAPELSYGETDTLLYSNKFPVGDLIIEKTVTKEYAGTVWNGDSFTFTVARTTAGRPLTAGNQYEVFEGDTKVGTSIVGDDNTLAVVITFDAEDAATLSTDGAEVKHSYTIKNLPAGTYSVVEVADADYVQSAAGQTVESGNPTISDLVLPAQTMPTAVFANELIRPLGSLSLEKQLVAADGYSEPLPEDTVFSFTIELLDAVPETMTVRTSINKADFTALTVTDGVFTVELMKNQTIVIEDLPIGSYRIIEATIPLYANAFAIKEGTDWVKQHITTMSDGSLYTVAKVEAKTLTEVCCTNTYPVARAELVLQKLVEQEYDRDKFTPGTYSFTLTFAEEDAATYTYRVYEENGSFVEERTVTATNKSIDISLTDGQYAVVTGGVTADGAVLKGVPSCGYSIVENSADTTNFNVSYEIYQSERGTDPATSVVKSGDPVEGSGASFDRTFAAGKTDTVIFTNEYRRHLGQLTISKSVDNYVAGDSFIFHINGVGVDMDVVLDGPGSVTIYDLPLGSYTVTEDTDWSWRYSSAPGSVSVTLDLDNTSAEAIFSNSLNNNKWINGEANVVNTFSAAAANS